MESREKTVKLLESFLSDKEVDGVCGYIVDPDGEGPIQVIVVLDIDYIKEANTKPGFVAKMIREGVKQEIKKWIGVDVYVGSTAKKCNEVEPLSESMSTHVKRRLTNGEVFNQLNTIMDYEFNASSFNSPLEYLEEVCNTLTEYILNDIWETTNLKVSLKEKDELYFYFIRKYEKYITKKYQDERSVDESKKKYVVTESQYNIILESQKHIQFFQDLIDNRMDYIRRVCDKGADDYEGDVGDESCRQIEELEKVKVTEADWVTIKHSNRETEEKYMSVKIMVYYSSIRRGDFDADDLTYDLEKMIRKSTGMPFILNYESTNTNTSWEW
jgi:hypothetical protein